LGSPRPSWLRSAVVTPDALAVEALDGGISRLVRVPFGKGEPAAIALPFDGTVREFEGDAKAKDLWVLMEGSTRAPVIVSIAANGKSRCADLRLSRSQTSG
jgi:hypothetical protein